MLMFLKRNVNDSPCRSLRMAFSVEAACVISGAVMEWRGCGRVMLVLVTSNEVVGVTEQQLSLALCNAVGCVLTSCRYDQGRQSIILV